MANVFDVASYILSKRGSMTTMKMQKLLYYAQAWSLVWDDTPLFDSRFEAWANGPVAPDYFGAHRGEYSVSTEPRGDMLSLTTSERETIDAVLEGYAGRTPRELSDLTHRERPWLDARRGVPDGARGDQEISHSSMSEYYGQL